MDSECDSVETSYSNLTEDGYNLNSLKSQIFSKSPPVFYRQIRQFHELITGDQLKALEIVDSADEIKLHSQIIVGIINKCIDNVAKIVSKNMQHMSVLLNPIKKLSDIFEHDMGKPLTDKYVHTDKLKSLYNMTQTRQSHINDISDELDARKLEHFKFTREKNNHINRTLEKTRVARDNLEQDVFNLVVCYEGRNSTIKDATTSRMSTVNHAFREHSKKFQLAVKMHKMEEKTLKNRKQKLDLQLAQWIEKYDKDIGCREDELQQLLQKYRNTSAEFTELETTMNKHEIIYNKSMLEKTTEEKRIFDVKLRALMYARAARTLQRAWRAHRAQQKRKKRRGGKRKQKQ